MLKKINTENFLTKAVQALITGVVFLTPLIFSTEHFYFFTTPKYLFLAGAGSLCFLLISTLLVRNTTILDINTKVLLWLSGGFLAWLLIASVVGLNFENSFWSNFNRHTGFSTYLFSYIFLLASLLVFKKETIYAPMKAFALGGALASLSVYLSSALGNVDWYLLKNSSNAGTFGNTTYAGIFLAFSFFSALVVFFKENKKSNKSLWAMCALVILLSPIFLNTKNIFSGQWSSWLTLVGEARAGLVSIFIGLIFSLLIYWYFKSGKIFPTLARAAFLFVFIGTLTLIASVFISNSPVRRHFLRLDEGVRLIYWDIAIQAIGESPVVGYGLENFYTIHKKNFQPELLLPAFPGESWTDKPHNGFLEVGVSAGITGLALYLIFIGFLFFLLIKKIQAANEEEKITGSILFGLLASYLFQIFFAFDTVSSLLAFYVTAALIGVFCFNGLEITESRAWNKLGLIFMVALSAILCLLIFYFFCLKIGEESKMIRKMSLYTPEEKIATFRQIMNISPVGALGTEASYIDMLLDQYKKNWPKYNLDAKNKIKKELEFLLQYSTQRSDAYHEDLRFAFVSSKMANMIFGISAVKNKELLQTSQNYGLRSIENSPFNKLGYQVMVESFILEEDYNMAKKFSKMLLNGNPGVPEFVTLDSYVMGLVGNYKK